MIGENCRSYSEAMLQTQLKKICDEIGSAAATDDETSLTCPRAHLAPPTLFLQPPTPDGTDDPFDDMTTSSLNHQMRTFIPKKWNSETYFSFPVDRLAFRHLFKLFARYGNPNKSAETMTLTNSDKWLRQAKVIDGRKITTVDTGIYFRQLAKCKKAMNMKEYEKYLDFIAYKKGLDPDQIKYMLTRCGTPKSSVKTKNTADDGGVDWTAEYNLTARDLRPRFLFPQRNLASCERIFDNEGPRQHYGYTTENVFCRFEETF